MSRRRWVLTDRRDEASTALTEARQQKSQAHSLVSRAERVRDELLAQGRVNGFEKRVRLAFEETR